MTLSVVTLFCLVLFGQALSFHTKGKSPQVDPRIINGEEAVPHSIPWQVSLELHDTIAGENSSCGGTLISPYYVLTAAHCIIGIQKVDVILGAHNISATESTQQKFTSSELKAHEDYDYMSRNPNNDIGLIRLPQAANFTDAVKAVELSTLPSEQIVGKLANLSGWGVENVLMDYAPDTLRVTQVNISPNSVCNTLDDFNSTLFICSNGPNDHGPCNGDSGGPLTIDGKLVGLVSHGSYTCNATTDKPAVFTRTSYYIDWIKKNTST